MKISSTQEVVMTRFLNTIYFGQKHPINSFNKKRNTQDFYIFKMNG